MASPDGGTGPQMVCFKNFLHILWGAFFFCAAPLLSFSEGLAQNSSPDQDPGVLTPTSGWLVGPASSSLPSGISGMPLPCVMTNQFDNGFVLRLSGGDHRLAALAIDFRQSVFTPGQHYPLRVFILPDYQGDFTAMAHDEGTLILSLRNDPSIYRALESAKAMDLSIGPTVARFDLTGLGDGLMRMESCFAPPPSSLPVQDVRALKASPVESGHSEIPDFSLSSSLLSDVPASPPGLQSLPVRGADPLNIFESSPQPLKMDERAVFSQGKLNGFEENPSLSTKEEKLSSRQSPSPPDASDASVWYATRGEDVQEVLSRWSEKAGVSLVWTARHGGRVGRDFRYEGTFDEAVQSFLAQVGKFQGDLRPDGGGSGLPEFQNKPADRLNINR